MTIVAVGGGHYWPQTVTYEGGTTDISYGDGISHIVSSDWQPGMTLGIFTVNGLPLAQQVGHLVRLEQPR